MLDIYPVEGPWAGQLALCARPRAGGWLEDDIRSLKNRGYDVLVSALTHNEVARLGLQEVAYVCHVQGIHAVQYPIGNMLVPEPGAVLPALREWLALLQEGRGLAVHCWATVGRSPMLAASLMVLAGVEPEVAWARLNTARGREVPDTREQREWVWQLASEERVELRPGTLAEPHTAASAGSD